MTTVDSIMVDIDNNKTTNEMKSPTEENVSFGENKSTSDVSVSDEERQTGVGTGEHGCDQQGNSRKRKRRRIKGGKHHRKWKPYDKLTWSEKKALEEKETIRATQKRQEAFASGHPIAPYNTTQFLMEDHIQSEASPDLLEVENGENLNVSVSSKHRDSFNSDGSSDSDYCADDDETFLAKEFSEAYDNIHAERLQTMSKEQLVKDFVELERKVETLEKKLKNSNQNCVTNERDNSDGTSLSSSGEELALFDLATREEMKRLKEDNSTMKKQIEEMKNKNGSC
ncbi:protein HEXIM1 [Patella vulgata]|uniref:protein HEXIM1 n=1 Tax=Patella vulgata TaxID=6465 RepID=UPI0021807FFF|nr:protein HEXIM1 [Patella vulgata]